MHALCHNSLLSACIVNRARVCVLHRIVQHTHMVQVSVANAKRDEAVKQAMRAKTMARVAQECAQHHP